MKTAAIYARVSSDRQKEEQTIASQTAALVEFASTEGYTVPDAWIFRDEGYSGSLLKRPGLERIRDLAAEGQLESILVHAPDRLSRRYAHQVLLLEELARHGVEVVFIKSPKATTPEEKLLLQFQGMIAEYERAQISERTRRGKKHRAREGTVSVLSGAPYGYRYVRKTEESAAYYEIQPKEAEVVRKIFKLYTKDSLSINAIARWLNTNGISTRSGKARWERSTVWGMLRNPAYKGAAAFGKTERAERQRVTRPLRRRGGFSPRCSANRELPREEWIEIPVPAIVAEEDFALAQEQLERNKRHSPRRTIEPTLLQSMLVCTECGYSYYRTSTRTSKRKIYYYRCLGSDDYRYPNGRVCQSRPLRQDYIDELVWKQVIDLLGNPDLIRAEIDRRLIAIQESDSTTRRKETVDRERARLHKAIDRLLDGYQDGLVELEEMRRRIPELRKRQAALTSELQSLEVIAADKQSFNRLAEQLEGFLARLRMTAQTMSVSERQTVLRQVVKEILVGSEAITIKHSIPIARSNPPTGPPEKEETARCLLRTRRHDTSLRGPGSRRSELLVRQDTGLQELNQKTIHLVIGNSPSHSTHE
jgi:site-specific DNA recombinase